MSLYTLQSQRSKFPHPSKFSNTRFNPKQQQSNYVSRKCGNCGGEHSSLQKACPAFGMICHNCRKENHFDRACRSKSAPVNKQAFQVDEIVDDMDDFFIGTVKNSSGDDDWSENIIIEVKLDTGSHCNVMSHNVYNTIAQNNIAQNNITQDNNSPIVASNARLVSYSGHKIIPIGKARFQCQHKYVIHQITFQIIDEEAPSLLGRKTCLEFGLIERIMTINQSDCGNNGDDILNQYPDLYHICVGFL